MTPENMKNWCDALGYIPPQDYDPSTWLSDNWDLVRQVSEQIYSKDIQAGAYPQWITILHENQLLIQL